MVEDLIKTISKISSRRSGTTTSSRGGVNLLSIADDDNKLAVMEFLLTKNKAFKKLD